MKKLTLVILGLGCMSLTGCGAHLHRQNQGIATIKEGSVREAIIKQDLSPTTPYVDVSLRLPVKIQYPQVDIDIDKEFTYAKKNLSPVLFQKFKQKVMEKLDYKQLFPTNFSWTDSTFHWDLSWRSCKVQSLTGAAPAAALIFVGFPVIFDAFLIPTQMFTSAGCGTIQATLEWGVYKTEFIDMKMQPSLPIMILKCKRAKCRIEDAYGNLIRTTPVITIQMVKNPQAEKELVKQIKEEAKEKERQAAEKRRKERRERAAEAERRAEEVRRHGGKMGYCLYIYKQVDELWSYPHLIQSAREIMLLSDYRALSCGSVLSIDL